MQRLASTTVITFEEHDDGTVLTYQYGTIDFNGARVVDCAASSGTCIPARSGRNAILPPTVAGGEFNNQSLIVLFDEPQASVSLYIAANFDTRSVSVAAHGVEGEVDTATGSIGMSWTRFQVSAAAGIETIEVRDAGSTSASNQFAVDDLSFDPLPPPPTSTPTATPSQTGTPSDSASSSASSSATATPSPTPRPLGPEVTILTPEDGLALTGTNPTVSLTYEVTPGANRIGTIEERLWYADASGVIGDLVFGEPWVECAGQGPCFGRPYRGSETILLPGPGHYVIGVFARDASGRRATETVSVSLDVPVDMWAMGIEWNQAVQEVVYTDLDRPPGQAGERTVAAGDSRVPLIQGMPIAVRIYAGLRPPSLVDVPLEGLLATGRLEVAVTHDGTTTVTELTPITNPDCANHLGEAAGAGCADEIHVPLSFGQPTHPREIENFLVDPFYDVEVAGASDYDLDLAWRRVQPERTLNFVIPGDLVSAIEPGDQVELRADVEPVGLTEAQPGDNRFTLTIADVAEPAPLHLRPIAVAVGGAGGTRPAHEQIETGLDAMMHLVPYSKLDVATTTPYFYGGHFASIRVRGYFLGIELVDETVHLDQCATLWTQLFLSFGVDRDETVFAFTPAQIEFAKHPENGGGDDCTGIGWRLPGSGGNYIGGIAHTRTPSDLDTVGSTEWEYAVADRPTNDFWNLVAVGAQELYHAHLDRRHVGAFHDERTGCPIDDEPVVELLGRAVAGMQLDTGCTKPAPHQHGTLGEYPMPLEPLRGDLGGLGMRIDGDASAGWNLTLYDPCPAWGGADLDPDDSIPWLNKRWSVFTDAHDCRRHDDDRAHDFMSYGEHRWTSVEQFSPRNIGLEGPGAPALDPVHALLTAAVGDDIDGGGDVDATSDGAAGLELTDEPAFRLWGVITGKGQAGFGDMMPIDALSETPLATEVDAADIYLEVHRVDGSVVNLAAFPSVQSAHGGDQHAFFTAEIPPGAMPDRVTLVRDAEAWTVIEESRAAPEVHVRAPNGGERWDASPETIRWEAGDTDGDDLVYRIEYSPDAGASWIPLGMTRTVTEFEIPAGQLAPTEEGVIRVVASDGLRFSADISDSTFCIGGEGECQGTTLDGDVMAAVADLAVPVGSLVAVIAAGVVAGLAWRRRWIERP